MEIKDRLQMFLDSKHLTASQFADSLHVQRSNVSHVLSGRNKPSVDFLEKMVRVFPDVNFKWLLTGEGSLMQIAYENQESKGGKSVFKLHEKSIVKIVTFYSDNTFSEYIKNQE